MENDADVVVVGGSVAGAATAAFLAQRGHSVVMLDLATFPRDKPCGEGLMPHGVDVLAQLGVLDRVLAAGARPLHGVRYTLDSGETVAAPFRFTAPHTSYALGIRRLALDDLLLQHAATTGSTRVRERFRVRGLLRQDGAVVGVTDGTTEVRGRVIVGADGLRSRVRTLLGWDNSRGRPRRYAAVGHFRLPKHRHLAPEVEVILAAGMEAYVTPLGGDEVLVALLGGRQLMRGMAGGLAGGFLRLVEAQSRLRVVLDGAQLQPGVRATGPFAVRARHVAGNGALLVGDAAGFLDPITGEGMAAALQQAGAAARVIDTALGRHERIVDLQAYTAAHRRISANGTLLTWVALALCISPAATARAMAGLQSRRDLFGKLLAINCGHAGLGSVSPRDWVALLSGR